MTPADLLQRASAAFARIEGYLNTLVIALVILLGGFILGRLVDRILHKLLLRVAFDDQCYKLFGRRRNYARATRRGTVYIIYILTVYFALQQLHLDRVALVSVLAIFVIIAIVSIFLGVVEIMPNLVARGRLKKRRIAEGDIIEVTDTTGTLKGKVMKMTVTDVQIKRSTGDIVFFPNSSLMKAKVTKKRVKKG